VDSSSLGRPDNLGTSVFGAGVTMAAEIPDRVDAHDGFDTNERNTEPAVEENLADTVNKLQLKLNQQEEPKGKASMGRDNNRMPGMPQFVMGVGSGTVQLEVAPEARRFMQETQVDATGNRRTTSGPHSSDMIPAVRGLSNLEVSYGSGSDVSMTTADSVLGKRLAGDTEVPEQRLELCLGLGYGAVAGAKSKRGKKGEHMEMKMDSVVTRTRWRSSTGHAPSDNLTRPNDGSRQEQ
jgi:hypothetical protein